MFFLQFVYEKTMAINLNTCHTIEVAPVLQTKGMVCTAYGFALPMALAGTTLIYIWTMKLKKMQNLKAVLNESS